MNKPEWSGIVASVLVILLSILVGRALDLLDLQTVLVGLAVSLLIFFGIVVIMLRYVSNSYERRLNRIVEELKSILPSAKYDWLYTADDVDEVEAHVKCKEIWVISPDLSNDTSLVASHVIEAVKKNLKRKIIYTYIVPDTETIGAVIPRLREIFSSFAEQLQVIKISPDAFKMLTVAHIVVYNPNMDGGQNPQVYLELPIDQRGYGKGFWAKVADDAALNLVGRFRKIIEGR